MITTTIDFLRKTEKENLPITEELLIAKGGYRIPNTWAKIRNAIRLRYKLKTKKHG
jgi:hypothetical protein